MKSMKMMDIEAFIGLVSGEPALHQWQRDLLNRKMVELYEATSPPSPVACGKKVEVVVVDDVADIPISNGPTAEAWTVPSQGWDEPTEDSVRASSLAMAALAKDLRDVHGILDAPPEVPEDSARGILMRLINDWPQFDTDEPVNGGDAVEYLESIRNDARKLLGMEEPDKLKAMADQPPMAFEYYEVLPCVEDQEGDIQSFRTEEEREAAIRGRGHLRRIFWTLYGRYPDIDGGLLAIAIGDFTLKADAMQVMNAILAPLAQARNAINLGNLREAADTLDDVINQSSNAERP